MKITAKRKKIIEVLQSHKNLVSARTLAKEITGINLATIYRTLDILVKENIAKKFVFNGTESLYEYSRKNHHHAICDDCKKVIHFNISDSNVIESIGIKNFNPREIEIIIRGKCIKKNRKNT